MLPTTVSSISASRAPSASGCSRLTRAEKACASASVRSMPIWMRKRPSGLAAAALSRAGPAPLGMSVWLVHALVLAPEGEDRGECACGAVSIDAVVDGSACGGLDGAGAAPPNQPAKGFDQPLLDGGGDRAASGEPPPADAVRAPRVAFGTAGAIDPPLSANPASS